MIERNPIFLRFALVQSESKLLVEFLSVENINATHSEVPLQPHQISAVALLCLDFCLSIRLLETETRSTYSSVENLDDFRVFEQHGAQKVLTNVISHFGVFHA